MAKKDTYNKLFNQDGQPPPTAQELSDYLNNRLSSREQHAFEQRLIDHPLLEEGMAGWQRESNKDVLSITQSLNRRMRQRTQRRRTTGKPAFWQLAAAVLLLLVGGVVLFGVMNQAGQKQGETLAEQPTAVEETTVEPVPAEEETQLPVTRQENTETQNQPQPSSAAEDEDAENARIQEETEAEVLPPTNTKPAKQERRKAALPKDQQTAAHPGLSTRSLARLEDRLAAAPSDALRLEIARRYHTAGQVQLAMVYLQKLQGDESTPEFAPALLLKAQIWLEHAHDTTQARAALRWLSAHKSENQEGQTAQEWLENLPTQK